MFLSQPWVNPSANNLNLAAASQHNKTGELISSVPEQPPSCALGPWELGQFLHSPHNPILPAHYRFGHPRPAWRRSHFSSAAEGCFVNPAWDALWLSKCERDGSHIRVNASQEGPWQGGDTQGSAAHHLPTYPLLPIIEGFRDIFSLVGGGRG